MIFLLKLLNRISGKINAWSENKIANYHPKIKLNFGFRDNTFAFVVFSLFLVFAFMVQKQPNIQDIKNTEKTKVCDTKKEKEFNFLKKHYTWLQRDVYYFILEESEKQNVDYIYIMSVIQYESGDYCANNWQKMITVTSYAGARGPMQIMPFHAKNPDDLFNWKYNIKKGIWYLSACLEAAGGNIRDAARRYNQGIHGNPRKYRNWKYVRRISNKYKKVLTQKVMVAKI